MALMLNRRGLLRAGLAAATVPNLRGMGFAAAGATAPLLILLNLRGGMDGLHVLSPADDRNFVDKRPPELRSLASGSEAGHRLDASAATDFRLHPRAAGLARIWHEGRMAIWPAAGVPETTRSHFEAQEFLGLGIGRRAERRPNGGWLASWCQSVNAASAVQPAVSAIAAMGALPAELRGGLGALAVPSTSGGLALQGGSFGAKMLAELYRETQGPAEHAGRTALASLAAVEGRLQRDAAGQFLNYQPVADANYAPARDFGRGLMVVAQLAKQMPELTTATLDLSGWDMHEGQPGRMRDLVGVLDAGLTALDRDLQGLGRRWTVLMTTEFGRRLRSNRSQGTDHGRAGLVIAFGDAGFGAGSGNLGRFFGPWPGLEPAALEEGVDLAVATDYRQAVTSTLANLWPTGPRPFRMA